MFSANTCLLSLCGDRTGKLTKDLSHLAVCFSLPSKNTVNIEIHHGSRKNVATLRTVKSIISNLITGVTKGYKYKMRYVYAHFPINVNIEKNKETGLYEVEVRYVWPLVLAEGSFWRVGANMCGAFLGGVGTSWARRLSDG